MINTRHGSANLNTQPRILNLQICILHRHCAAMELVAISRAEPSPSFSSSVTQNDQGSGPGGLGRRGLMANPSLSFETSGLDRNTIVPPKNLHAEAYSSVDQLATSYQATKGIVQDGKSFQRLHWLATRSFRNVRL